MGKGPHYTDILPEEYRVSVKTKQYRISKTNAYKAGLVRMSRENLPEGARPVVELDNPTLEEIKQITEVVADIKIQKFRDSKANMLLAALRCGMSVKKACQLAGITVWTYRAWYERGQNGEEPYKQFYDILEAVQLEMEQWCLRAIKDAADPNKIEKIITTIESANGDIRTTTTEKPVKADWRAAAYLLEHIDPESYGKERDTQPTVTNNTQIVVQLPNNGRAIDSEVKVEPKPKPRRRAFRSR